MVDTAYHRCILEGGYSPTYNWVSHFSCLLVLRPDLLRYTHNWVTGIRYICRMLCLHQVQTLFQGPFLGFQSWVFSDHNKKSPVAMQEVEVREILNPQKLRRLIELNRCSVVGHDMQEYCLSETRFRSVHLVVGTDSFHQKNQIPRASSHDYLSSYSSRIIFIHFCPAFARDSLIKLLVSLSLQ